MSNPINPTKSNNPSKNDRKGPAWIQDRDPAFQASPLTGAGQAILPGHPGFDGRKDLTSGKRKNRDKVLAELRSMARKQGKGLAEMPIHLLSDAQRARREARQAKAQAPKGNLQDRPERSEVVAVQDGSDLWAAIGAWDAADLAPGPELDRVVSLLPAGLPLMEAFLSWQTDRAAGALKEKRRANDYTRNRKAPSKAPKVRDQESAQDQAQSALQAALASGDHARICAASAAWDQAFGFSGGNKA